MPGRSGPLVVQIPLAWIMTDQPLGPAKLENYALHKSIGMLLLTIGAARILVALAGRRPRLPADMSRPARWAARTNEILLFVLIVLMPITGWIMSSAANTPVSVFGWFTLPDLVEPDEGLLEAMKQSHRAQSWLLLALIGVHVLAALRHFFLLRDNVLYSMLPFRRLKRK